MRSSPSRHSMTKYVDPSSSSPKSLMSTMCWLPIPDALSASRRKRASTSGSFVFSRRSTLIASGLLRRVWVTRYTSPMPPSPSRGLDAVPLIDRSTDQPLGCFRDTGMRPAHLRVIKPSRTIRHTALPQSSRKLHSNTSQPPPATTTPGKKGTDPFFERAALLGGAVHRSQLYDGDQGPSVPSSRPFASS